MKDNSQKNNLSKSLRQRHLSIFRFRLRWAFSKAKSYGTLNVGAKKMNDSTVARLPVLIWYRRLGVKAIGLKTPAMSNLNVPTDDPMKISKMPKSRRKEFFAKHIDNILHLSATPTHASHTWKWWMTRRANIIWFIATPDHCTCTRNLLSLRSRQATSM